MSSTSMFLHRSLFRLIMQRQQKMGWMQRWARPLIAALATIGAIDTAYLTYAKLAGNEVVCPITSCNQVAQSPYSTVFGVPLSLFGLLAYLGIVVLAIAPLLVPDDKPDLRRQLNQSTWFLLFIATLGMVLFSVYLMFLLAFVIQAACIYCIVSAIATAGMFGVMLVGHPRKDPGQLAFIGFIVAVLVLVSSLGLYNLSNPTAIAQTETRGPAITTTSGPAEISLAQHLTAIGAKEYGAWWCPHCYEQKQLFGKEAFGYVNYVECASDDDPQKQTEACATAGVRSYPSWDINGELLPGVRSLNELADLSGYTGSRDFKN